MSDKNGTQWTKATAAAALAAQQKNTSHTLVTMGPTHHQQQPIYTQPTNLMPAHTPLFGVSSQSHVHLDGITPYTTARFPPPIPPQVISHHVAALQSAGIQQPSPTHNPSTGLTSPSASPNVPAQSGFIPPPLLTPTMAAVAGATSSRFVAAEQLSLSKIINVMQQHASNTANANTSNTPATTIQPTSTTQRRLLVEMPMSSGGSGSSGLGANSSTVGGSICAGSAAGNAAITSSIAENVLDAISATPNTSLSASVPAVHGRLTGIGVKVPDEDKLRRIQHLVESEVSESAKQQIMQILDHVATLQPVEKLLLYLRLPGDAPETDPLRHPQNPLGTRSEINHTINWVRSHLEHDPKVSIPKQDVYNDYLAYCDRLDIKPLSTADFGKVMKQVFPGIRPRRLGTRGHSRYCYAAMRKTTKLKEPQLPKIDSASVTQVNETALMNCESNVLADDVDAWGVIKKWAEQMLHVKVDNIQQLAACIKEAGNAALSSGSINTTHGRGFPLGPTHHKKYTSREPKEKRQVVDIGPLKKRRKKKRKGSSSSESSCGQSQQLSKKTTQLAMSNNPNCSHTHNTSQQYSCEGVTALKSNELIQIKQEVPESPNLQHIQQVADSAPLLTENYLKQQQQLLPMNLVTEQRTVLPRAAATSASAFGVIQTQQQRTSFLSTTTAVKNLTPTIMEISTTSSSELTSNVGDQVTTIKEEDYNDDYNPNIFCKKVRKAQQTKGFWTNSPTTSSNAASNITNSSTGENAVCSNVTNTTVIPVLPPPAQNSSVEASTTSVSVGVVSPSFLMGPPSQVNTSISPCGVLHSEAASSCAASPKVASRNLMQLRAKRQQSISTTTSNLNNDNASNSGAGGGLPDTDPADLPSNLGLPRERVISICNMDKHELDDYLMTAEVEEDAEDQETELLQYFQTGDAEEKQNSLDAAKNKTPTATSTIVTNTVTTQQQTKTQSTGLLQAPMRVQATQITINSDKKTIEVATENNNIAISIAQTTTTTVSESPVITFATASKKSTSITTTMSSSVGSASASLALMSQKHQHLQQQNRLAQLQSSRNVHKRKINLSGTTMNPIGVMVPRKNCFMPISPNINSEKSSPVSATCSGNNNVSANNYFLSPVHGAHRGRILFSKQLSLDHDSCDPMIGARGRRRSYASPMSNPGNSFMPMSSSAPPSPSFLQQQQQLYGTVGNFFCGDSNMQTAIPLSGGYNDSSNNASTGVDLLAADQNSLDLDLFGTADTAAATAVDYHELTLDDLAMPLNETQRSQSVPLSQLQRSHSPSFNRSFQAAPYSACASVAQTPVLHDFADSSTIFSENSSSQNSGVGVRGGRKIQPSSIIALQARDSNVPSKLDDASVLASDSTIFESMYVSEILPENIEAKFPQANTTTTTCSSAESSSGYSTATFGSSALMSSIGGGTITSRSVPSTPLPHQQQQSIFGNFHGSRRLLDDDTHLKNVMASEGTTFRTTYKQSGSCGYDISRSMPTTPITTPRFRYSPTDFSRELSNLSNGNTLDSLISGGTGGANGDGVNESLNVALNNFTASDTLIDESCGLSTDGFASNGVVDAETIIADSELLDNL